MDDTINHEASPGNPDSAGLDVLAQLPHGMFKTIFMASPEAIALTRASDNVMVAVNPEWVRLTGFAAQQVLGRSAVDIGLWPDATAREQALRPLLAGEPLRDVDITLVLRDGTPRMICANVVLIDVQSESYILFYLRDVTADRMAQAAVLAGEQALAQANEKLNRQVILHQMTESMAKVGYWVVYPGDGMVQLSHGYCEIGYLGNANRAPVGAHLQWIVEEDRDIVKRALKKMDGEIVEYRWRRPDGVTVWLRSRIQRQIEQGAIKAEFGIVQDISAERAALQAAADQLSAMEHSEARFRSLTELTSDWYWEQDANYRFVRIDGDVDTARALPDERVIGKTRWDSGVEGVGADQWAAHRAALDAR